MSTIDSKVERLEGCVNDLKIEVVGINHSLQEQGSILRDLKEVLVNQNKTLENVFHLQGRVEKTEEGLSELQKDYRTRKQQTDEFMRSSDGFLERIRGGFVVAGVCFSLIQGIVGFNLMSATNTIERNSSDIKRMEAELAAAKAKSEYMKETLDKLLTEEKKNHNK